MAASVSPLNRNGYPEDVARVVGFMASNEAAWINGKVITGDGDAA
jgi:tetrahydroxynaphthalene reductase